jgi:hypothetical protein
MILLTKGFYGSL